MTTTASRPRASGPRSARMPRTRRVVMSSPHRVSNDWSRCRAAVAATTGRAGSRSRWARWSPRASGSRKPTTKAEGTSRQSTRSAAPDGDLEVTAAEEPRGPRDADDGERGRGESGQDPAEAALGRATGAGGEEADEAEHDLDGEDGQALAPRVEQRGQGQDAERRREQGERADPGEQRSALRLRVGCRLGGCHEVDDAVGVVDDAGVVGRDDDRRTLVTGRGQDARDGRPRQPVLPDRGLVGEHERGAVRDGGRHRQAPLLAAGELARVGVGEVGEPECGEQGVGPAAGDGGVVAEGERVSSARRHARCDRRARWLHAAAPRPRRARGRARTTRAVA